MAKLKTFRVLMAETHGQYYEVLAEDEDQAVEKSLWLRGTLICCGF